MTLFYDKLGLPVSTVGLGELTELLVDSSECIVEIGQDQILGLRRGCGQGLLQKLSGFLVTALVQGQNPVSQEFLPWPPLQTVQSNCAACKNNTST
jgi:hypothetical protein